MAMGEPSKPQSETVLGRESLIAFVATAEPARSKAFYEQILGLRLIADEEHAIVFDANGTMLRIQKVTELVPPPHTALGWRVRDIARTVTLLRAKQVEPERYPYMQQDALGIWTAPSGAKVVWFKDPDGNLLSLTELSGP
jgi:catechol 2,3-dioxygenase-like lactoylglutathione lyase family enzyme